MKLWLYTLAAVAAAVLALAGAGALGAAIDNPTGCMAQDLGPGDDNSSPAVTLPFSVNFFGTTYDKLFVNNNGNVTFDAPLGDYTPNGMPNLHIPLIAPFFADVDTRNPASGTTHYGTTTFGGKTAFCVLWDNVGYFNTHANKLNNFQLLLVDRGAGDFDAVFNYDTMNWETGDADSGVDGLGGKAAEVGFTNLDQHFTMIGSQVSGAFLDTNPAGLAHGSFNAGGVAGRYVFRIRNGSPGLGNPVSGTVRESGGSVVPDTLLQLCPHGGAGGEACLTTNSRSDGSYTFVDVVDGTWDLVAFPPEAAGVSGGSLSGLLVNGGALTGRDVTLAAGPATPPPVNGLVKTATGDPLAGATVTVLTSPTSDGTFLPVPDGSTLLAPGARANPVTTDSTGTFTFDAIAGYYRIQAAKDGCFKAGDQTQSYDESPTLTLPPAPGHIVLALDCSDVIPPAIMVNAPSTVEATSAAGAPVTFTVSAIDNVDGPVPVTCDRDSGTAFPLGDTTVNCTATDKAGNKGSASFTVSVVDTAPPALDLPATITVAEGTPVVFTVSATDVVDGAVPVDCDKQSGVTFPLGKTTVHCSATDAHHNTANGQFDVVVTPLPDTTPPVLTLPATITKEATGPAGAAASFTASAVDNVDGPVPVDCDKQSGATFPLGTTTVHCSAKDAAGNTGSGQFDIVVQDTTAPTLQLPSSPLTLAATSPGGAIVSYTATANDLVDGAVGAICLPSAGQMFVVGTTTVHCTATDAHHNTANGQFDVVVTPLPDTTPPVLTLPATITKEATGPAGAAASFTASAVDNVDGPVPVDCDKQSGATFPLGTTTVHCTAKDAANNTGSGQFDIVVQDTTAPTLHVPSSPVTAEATSPAGAVVSYTATATDLVDGSVSVSCSKPSGSTFPLGTTTVDCTATDAAGNPATGHFDVAVTDTTAPTLHVPSTVTAEATSPAGAAVSFSASAFDLVDGSVAVSCSKPSGSTFPVGTSTVHCTATDTHGNTGVGDFMVGVLDTTPPVVTVPTTITREATSTAGAAVTFTVTASDVVDGSVAVTCSKTSGSIFPVGKTTVDCTATDAHHNSGTGHFDVVVTDTTPPALEVPATITVPEGTVVTFTVKATDIVDGAVPVTCDHASGSTFPVGTTKVTCTATDKAGNKATASFDVSVTPRPADTTPPVLTVPLPITANATLPGGTVLTYSVSAVDAVDGPVSPTCTKASGSLFPIGTTTVTCTARDASGNAATKSFTVHVNGAKEQLEGLLVEVTRQSLGPGMSIATKLHDAIDALEAGASGKACLILRDLEALASAQAGKKLTAAQAEWLRSELARIERVLGC